MSENDVVFVAVLYHSNRFKSLSIIYDQPPWTSKSRENILKNEVHDDLISVIPSGNCLYPFCKAISGCQNILVLATGVWVDLSNKV